MKHTISSGGVVLNSKGEVLIVNQNNDSWSLPKGHIDPGESALEAACREIHEESGVKDLILAGELGVYSRPRIGLGGTDSPSEVKTIHVYLFTTKEMQLKPLDPHNPAALWVRPEDVADRLTHPKDKEFFLSVFDKIKSLGRIK